MIETTLISDLNTNTFIFPSKYGNIIGEISPCSRAYPNYGLQAVFSAENTDNGLFTFGVTKHVRIPYIKSNYGDLLNLFLKGKGLQPLITMVDSQFHQNSWKVLPYYNLEDSCLSFT